MTVTTPIAAVLAGLALVLALAVPSCAEVAGVYDLHTTASYGADPQQYMDISYATARPADTRWVMVVHGGSWINKSPANEAHAAAEFYAHGWQVFNVEYRRGPDVTLQMQIDDLTAATEFIKAHAGLYRIGADRGVVYGFSAGGHLAAMVGQTERFRGVVTVSGVLQPQRVADDDNGLRSDEPTTPQRHNLHLREIAMMGCDWTSTMTPDCATAWGAFLPQNLISGSSPPFYIMQGTDDVVVPPPTASAFGYWLGRDRVPHAVVTVDGLGHDEAVAMDGGSREHAMMTWVLRVSQPTSGGYR